MILTFPEQRPFYAVPPGYGFHRLTVPELAEQPSLFNTLQIFEHPRKGHRYVVGVDASEGLGQDRSVAAVVRMATLEEPAEEVAQYVTDDTPPRAFAGILDAIGHLYVGPDGLEAMLAIETNLHGLSVQDTLQLHLGYRHFYVWEVFDQADPGKRFTTRLGWATTPRSRPILLDQFHTGATTLDPITGFSDLRVNSRFTMDEMRDFSTEGALWEAAASPGQHDDCVMALAIAHIVAWRLMGGETEPLADRRRRRAEEQALQAQQGAQGPVDYRNTDATADDQRMKEITHVTERDPLDPDDDPLLFYDPSGRSTAGPFY